jgi:hypothetical protein
MMLCRDPDAGYAKNLDVACAEAFNVVTFESDEDWAKYKGSVENRA